MRRTLLVVASLLALTAPPSLRAQPDDSLAAFAADPAPWLHIEAGSEQRPPVYFTVLFYGLIVWGVAFCAFYLLSGWSSQAEFQAKMRNHVLLGGGGSQIGALGRAIEEALGEYGGGKVTTVEEPQYAGSNGALKIALDMPAEYWTEFSSKLETAAPPSARS